MADISKIVLPTGAEVNIKDSVARSIAAGGIQFRGITTTALYDGRTIATYSVDGESLTAQNGDLVIYQKSEFIFSSGDNKWHELGDNDLGDLAYRDSVSGVLNTTVHLDEMCFLGTEDTIDLSGVPQGDVKISTLGGNDNEYTPTGSVSLPEIEIVESKSYFAQVTDEGYVSHGHSASCTFPSLNFSISGETLNIDWTNGTFSTNTPTEVSLPTFTQEEALVGVGASIDPDAVSFEGDTAYFYGSFTGDDMYLSGTFTPHGTLGNTTFDLNENITMS